MSLGSTASKQRGFGAIASIIVLVVLASLAAAVVRFGTVAQETSASSVMAARALQSARAGTEWGLYQALKGSWTTCSGASQTLDLSASTGYRVTVTCNSDLYNEGESSPGVTRTVRLYTLDAVACSGSGNCPDNTAATQAHYIERRRQVQASN